MYDRAEHRENLTLEWWEDSEEPAASRREQGLRRRICFVSPSSLYLKMLGICLGAEQFTTASAEGVCQTLEGLKGKFELLGLICAFKTAAATKSLSYSAFNDDSFYVTGHIGPGSLSVASSLLEATGSRLAQLLAFGGGGNLCELVQLDCPERLHYIGLKSNTDCPVGNPVGASLVREYHSLWETNKQKKRWDFEGSRDGEEQREGKLGRRLGREATRHVKVIILEVGRRAIEEDSRTKEVAVSLKTSRAGTFLLGWLPLLLTMGVTASCINSDELLVAKLIVLGTLGMMVAVLGLRLYVMRYSKPQVAKGAPPGDCLIVDETDPDTLHVVLGEEESIQALFQRKIDVHQALFGKHLLLLAGFILYVYAIASILYMPSISWIGQIHFAIANLIGFVADMAKAYHNGTLGLAKKACEQFKIVVRDVVVFGNRTAAVAFVAKHAEDRSMLRWKKLLPCDGSVWEKWWETLGKCDDENKDFESRMKSVVAAAQLKDQALLELLLHDMVDGVQA